MTTGSSKEIGLLLAKQAITECIVRMAHALDRVDADGVRAAFWPEGRIESGTISAGIADYIPVFEETLRTKWTRTTHQLSNMLIEVDGDRARSETYVNAYHEFADMAPIKFIGRYIDDHELRGGEWRILNRLLLLDWQEGARHDEVYPISASKRVRGARKPLDPWYTRKQRPDSAPPQ
jgi:hypothetical protein